MIEALLARDFNLHTLWPRRLVLLWSWLKYDPHGTPFVHDWATRQRAEDWGVLVGNAARAGLEDIGLLASEMHIFLHSQEWDRTVGAAFAAHADLLAESVSGATDRDWYTLRCLAAAVGHTCPEVAPRLVERWDPATAAATLSATHPDYYHSVFWFFGPIAKHSRAWCEEVGRRVDWGRVSRNLEQVRPGDLDTVEQCCSILGQLGVPLRRSMIRRYAEVMRRVLERVSLCDLRPGLGHDLAIVLQLFPAEVEALAAALDPGRLAAELSAASPRHWRVLGELVAFLRASRSGVYREIINLLDRPRFVATVSAYGPSHPYELRCLLWLLRNGSEEARSWLAAALFETVAAACEASKEERPQLLEAFSYLDEGLAEKLAARLQTAVIRMRTIDDRPLEDRSPVWRRAQEQLPALDATGEDYVVGPFVEEPVAEVQRADMEALNDPPDGQ